MKPEPRSESLQQTEATLMYRLNGIPLLPHYLQGDTFVQPGHTKQTPLRTFSTRELQEAGAKAEMTFLWPRANW